MLAATAATAALCRQQLFFVAAAFISSQFSSLLADSPLTFFASAAELCPLLCHTQIKWTDSVQATWDSFVMLANTLTQQIMQIKDM